MRRRPILSGTAFGVLWAAAMFGVEWWALPTASFIFHTGVAVAGGTIFGSGVIARNMRTGARPTSPTNPVTAPSERNTTGPSDRVVTGAVIVLAVAAVMVSATLARSGNDLVWTLPVALLVGTSLCLRIWQQLRRGKTVDEIYDGWVDLPIVGWVLRIGARLNGSPGISAAVSRRKERRRTTR
jgi:hypothetical protein